MRSTRALGVGGRLARARTGAFIPPDHGTVGDGRERVIVARGNDVRLSVEVVSVHALRT